MTTRSQLQLEQFEVTRLLVESRPIEEYPENVDEGIRIQYALNKSDDSRNIRVRFGAMVHRKIGGKRYQFLEAEVLVHFGFAEGTTSEAIKEYVSPIFVAHATGIVRHVLAEATTNTAPGPYRLPLLNVSAVNTENQANEDATSEQETTESTGESVQESNDDNDK